MEHCGNNASITVTDVTMQWQIQGRGQGGPPLHRSRPPLFLDQTEFRKAEKFFLETALPPPRLSKGLDDRPSPPPPPLSQGLDPALP